MPHKISVTLSSISLALIFPLTKYHYLHVYFECGNQIHLEKNLCVEGDRTHCKYSWQRSVPNSPQRTYELFVPDT